MTQETDELAEQIRHVKDDRQEENTPHPTRSGYGIAINILTDLFGCVLIGLGLGVLFQEVFGTSAYVTASLTMLGGIAGLWTVIRYGINLDKQKDNNHGSDASI